MRGDYQWAIIIVLVICLIYFAWKSRQKREGFVSKEAQDLSSNAKSYFDSGGSQTSYASFKSKVPGADPVKFNDTRKLWKEGNLTPETVQSTL